MKIKQTVPIIALAIITGCAAAQLEGTNFDSYIQKNGVPANYYTMQNGNKLYFYRTRCTDSKNWQEYNIEVTPENTIVKKTIVKNCPLTVNNQQNNTLSATDQKIKTLSSEWMNVMNQSSQVYKEYTASKASKGAKHQDTIALWQKYLDLSAKEKELSAEISELRK